MTRREYAESRLEHYWDLFMNAPWNSCAETSYHKLFVSWQSFLKFHDYIQKEQHETAIS